MREFVIVQEQDPNDPVAVYNMLFCKKHAVSYYPYQYFTSILTLEMMKPHFKYVIQIDKERIIADLDSDALLEQTPRRVYFGDGITFLNMNEEYNETSIGKLPENLIILQDPDSEKLKRDISINRVSWKHCEIVVARYNERVDWLQCFDPSMLRLYNKGGVLNSIPNFTLPNVGREAHTYLHHIVAHYDNLSEYVMFTQASLTNNEGCLTNPFEFITELIQSSIYNMGVSRNYLRYDHIYPTKYDMRESKATQRSAMMFGEWFENFVKQPFEKNPKWFKGAVMCLSRSLIHSREKSYYEELLETVSAHVNLEEAYYLERSWYYIFQQRRVFLCFGLNTDRNLAISAISSTSPFVDIFMVLDEAGVFEDVRAHIASYLSKIYHIKPRARLDHEITQYHAFMTEVDRVFDPNNQDVIIFSNDRFHPNSIELKEQLEKKDSKICRMNTGSLVISYELLKSRNLSDIIFQWSSCESSSTP